VHYRRAMELKLMGVDHEAARELTWLTEHYARDREALVELSMLLSQAGAHHHALQVATLHFKEGIEHGGEPVPHALWSAAYPTAYLPTIRTHVGTIVDPYLVLAIIREESQYDARATSSHGAVGLMQMMPMTAQALAKQYGHPELKREDLYEHDTNIRFGVRYLEELLQQFSGNVVHAVAAYNAGGPTVAGWIAKNGHKEPDEFVEMIPYLETRQYVKRVLRTYREYHRLGDNACGPGFLDKVC
jgi:soluble lytic murein transglycosylase